MAEAGLARDYAERATAAGRSLGLGPVEFARIAAKVLTPRRPPTVSTDHIHAPFVSIREQARRMAAKLRDLRRASFRRLTSDCAATYEVVACFLALSSLSAVWLSMFLGRPARVAAPAADIQSAAKTPTPRVMAPANEDDANTEDEDEAAAGDSEAGPGEPQPAGVAMRQAAPAAHAQREEEL